jgi:YD repeat-containing protein
VLALLICLGSVAVSGADQLPEEPAPSPVAVPSAEQVQAGIEAAEEQQGQREEELQAPEAVQQREASRSAYSGLAGVAARQLLVDLFPGELARLNADPARVLSEVEVVKAFGDTVATVEEDGDGSLLEAGIPVRAENEDGELEKVDLSLEATPTGFEPANPLTELQIPGSAGGPIVIGEAGLAVSLVDADGEAVATRLGDKNAFYPEVQTDTDLLVAPTAAGVELFDQLRSAESPEALHFHLDLPGGGTLRSNGAGAAEIVDGDEVIAVVAPPTALDAQGTEVPVELLVEGETLTLQVPHRERDFAYPILVDPAISENYEAAWYWGSDTEALDIPNVWQYATNDPTEKWILHSTWCLRAELCSPSGRGLFVSTVSANMPASVYGQWYYTVPGATTFIPSIYPEPSAAINPFWRHNYGCSWGNYGRPYDYDGSFDASGTWQWFNVDRAQWYGNDVMYTKAKGIAFGMSTGAGGYIPCWRNIMAGGVAVRLDDPEAPTISSVSGPPSGWVGDGSQVAITVAAQDPGLGVRNVTLTPQGALPILYTPAQSECAGSKTHPCPASFSAPFSLGAKLFDEGERTASLSAYDPTGKTSATYEVQTRVDRTPPTVVLGGQLALATDEDAGDAEDPEKWDELRLPVYNLKIEAEDGSTETAAKKRSGVKAVEVFLDGNGTPEKAWQQSCPTASCPMTQGFSLKLNELTTGTHHTLTVIVTDQVGEERERKVEFEYIPVTGSEGEYVMQHFPLPDGEDHEGEEVNRGPELAVNLTNGNLVYHERDVDVEGAAVDLEVERFYNSLLPESENTEWGDGWTLAQTPALRPDEGSGDEATIVSASGAIQSDVALPEEEGGASFKDDLHAVLTKEDGGYELADASGETGTAFAFDSSGRTTELRTEGEAKVDYDYAGGDLAAIAVEDPASIGLPPDQIEEASLADDPAHSGSLGSKGSGAGQLEGPQDIAVAPDGSLWAVDSGNGRVEHFNSAGEYLGQFSGQGSGDGQLNIPSAVAVDPTTGDILVADRGNIRLQRFSSSGAFLGKFSSFGSGNGQLWFYGPGGIAVDPQGNAWVTDIAKGRVQEFNPAGEFVRSVGSVGSGPGQLSLPRGVDIGPAGNVWIADTGNNRVSVFKPNGEFVRQFGVAGSGEGQLSSPWGIDVDSRGKVWVSDENAHVQQFTEDGSYVTRFGGAGSGQGQLQAPKGVAADERGAIWVADSGNNRAQRWDLAGYSPVYSVSVGTEGSDDGQLEEPQDVALAADGSVWIVDTVNDRVQHLDAQGEYVGQFGEPGSADGQLNAPTAIASDPTTGDLLVADRANHRVQRFTANGQYLGKFGSLDPAGGNGKFGLYGPGGVAVDSQGHVWASDVSRGRVQEFSPAGEFIRAVGSSGSGPGQLLLPRGIEIGASGNLLVADTGNDRISVFLPNGEPVRQFGTAGTEDGQLSSPWGIEADEHGSVWVSDESGRVQEFTEDGTWFAGFGSEAGDGQLQAPKGLATDEHGAVWIADSEGDRVQRWTMDAGFLEMAADADGDPRVEVATPAGLVTELEGEQAGEHSYEHEGDLLTAHVGPEGETKYGYDSAGRLTGVELPNGTTAGVEYDAAYERVKAVTVDPAGSTPAKTTHFEYSDEPRRTVVTPDGEPATTYDIGPDGSVLKWWNAEVPPDFSDIAGSLYQYRETEAPIPAGDQNLLVQAHSEEGIASIEVIADNTNLVDEKTCKQDFEKPGIECVDLVNEWVANTADLSPGVLQLEALITDRLGQVASERFWVNVPYTPPPPNGAPAPPKFADILHFREEFGLDLDLDPAEEELELNDRIFDLIGAWYNPQTPAGEVARVSSQRWGVPLRPIDIAELEYRQLYVRQAALAVPQWAEAHDLDTYAGYYVDHRAGGIVHIGFTQEQAATVSEFAQDGEFLAPGRIASFASTPQYPYSDLAVVQAEIAAHTNSLADITQALIDIKGNTVRVGTSSSVPAMATALVSLLGPHAPTNPFFDAAPPGANARQDRDRLFGRVKAGDRVRTEEIAWCTASFGAWQEVEKLRGTSIFKHFLLTAAHCADIGEKFYREAKNPNTDKYEWADLGKVRRIGTEGPAQVDGEAILLQGTADSWAPRAIYLTPESSQPVTGIVAPTPGMLVCSSGVTTDKVECGPVEGPPVFISYTNAMISAYEVPVGIYERPGDSGAPVWQAGTGNAVGLWNAGTLPSFVTPLLPMGTDSKYETAIGALAPGVLAKLGFAPDKLSFAR